MKEFYAKDGVNKLLELLHADSVSAADTAHAAMAAQALASLEWFWAFIHQDRIQVGDETVFEYQRSRLLNALSETNITFVLCFHYLTNHLIEDYHNFGPLYFLIGEGAEAAHAAHNRMRRPTLRGRQTESDTWNSFACMLRNLLALHNLVSRGLLAR